MFRNSAQVISLATLLGLLAVVAYFHQAESYRPCPAPTASTPAVATPEPASPKREIQARHDAGSAASPQREIQARYDARAAASPQREIQARYDARAAASPQREIQGRYDARSAAMKAKDPKAYLEILHKDYREIDENGQSQVRKDEDYLNVLY